MQGHKIHAMVVSKLFKKLKLSLKKEAVYIMYNFRVSVNEIQKVMTTSHKYCLNFIDKTKIRPVFLLLPINIKKNKTNVFH